MTTSWRVGDDLDVIDPAAMGRLRDCKAGGGRNNPRLTMIEWLVEHVTHRSGVATGALIIHAEQFEEMSRALMHKSVDVTRAEFRELHATGTIEILARDAGDARFRVTDTGIDRWAEIVSARQSRS